MHAKKWFRLALLLLAASPALAQVERAVVQVDGMH